MFFPSAFLFAFTVISVNAIALNGTVLRRQTNIDDKPTCGTTGDATLSDCRDLLNNWPAFPDWSPTCHYSVTQTAWRPACSPGNCCIYTDWNGGLWEDIKTAFTHLLDCGDAEKNKVNGVINVVDSGRVCVSDGKGCSDCFED